MNIDIMEVAQNIIGKEKLSKLPNDKSIKFLESLRLFYEDAKTHGKNHVTGCRENVIEEWQNSVAEFIKGNKENTYKVIGKFYDLIYEKWSKKE